MRVVHVFKDYYPPTTGGIEQHMRLLCTGLARQMDVTVLVPSRSRRTLEERLDGVLVIRVPEYGRYASVPLCPTMPVQLRRLRPDIVHLHFPNPMGDLAYLLSGWGAPLVITYHADIIKQRPFVPFYRPVLALLFKQAQRIIATSPDYIASSRVLSRYRRKTTIIPFGVDREALSLRDGEATEVEWLRRDLGRRLVVFVGVLRYYKGLDILLRAMTKVAGCLLIVGSGPERERLEAMAVQLGVANRALFLGEVPESRLRVLLHGAEVFVLPSIDRCEAFGIAQLEAMACGKPVVSTDLPTGVRFVNPHGVTGLRVPPRDPDALADAVNRLLDDPQLRAHLGQAAQERVEREFTAEGMITRTLEVYREVLVP
ncbi:MAG: glycosyltransferase [candidate division NC10 bacterium]|nr:glycosyltransferase [candidate division NC10 bacterium]